MTTIRYICLSDLHLGADNSLLTELGSKPGEVKTTRPSPVLEGLTNCIQALIVGNSRIKPTLVLNGDALELALAEDNDAWMAFERFMELMFPAEGEPLIDPNIIFNPGNHDHHLWEAARETQYVDFLAGRVGRPPGKELPRPWHTTKMFDTNLVPSSLLNAIIRRHKNMAQLGVNVSIAYPNWSVFNDDRTRCVIFSHGHYIESIYWLMTTLGNFIFPKREIPRQIWDIETENFAWIDFFWSAMGRSGAVGKTIEQIYDMLLVPDVRARLVRKLARAAGHDWLRQAPKLGEWVGLFSVPLVSKLLNRIGALEKTQTREALSPAARLGLKGYIEGPLAAQILKERGKKLEMPTSFIFGHTHKPFSEAIEYDGFLPKVAVYNSGGWVVDTKETEPTHGGAVVVIDEQMNVASLRMYNEADSGAEYQVRVEAVTGNTNPLYVRLSQLVKPDAHPWRSFSRSVAMDVGRYHENFKKRLQLVGEPGPFGSTGLAAEL